MIHLTLLLEQLPWPTKSPVLSSADSWGRGVNGDHVTNPWPH